MNEENNSGLPISTVRSLLGQFMPTYSPLTMKEMMVRAGGSDATDESVVKEQLGLIMDGLERSKYLPNTVSEIKKLLLRTDVKITLEDIARKK